MSDRIIDLHLQICTLQPQSWICAGVSLGAVLGHALATLLAVTGGAFASKYISERALGYAGGSLFLLFAALTLLGVF